MSQANMKAVITAEDRASAVIAGVGNSVDDLGSKVTKSIKYAAVAAFTALSAAIAVNIDDAVKRVDTLNNSARTFENMGFTAKNVDVAMKALTKSILGLPTPLDEAVRGMSLIAASTNDIGKGQKIFTSLNNAILGFGGTTDMVSNAVVQLSQDLAGGRITAQTWLSLLNSGLGPALAAMARQMGKTTRELREGLSEGSISVDSFVDSLITMNEKGGGGMKSFEQIAKDSTKGIGSSWANMQTAITRGIAAVIEGIGSSNIADAIKGIGKAFEDGLKMLPPIIKGFQDFARQVGDYLGPKFETLANTISTKVFPVLKSLWDNVLAPLIPVIGTTLVIAIGAAVDGFNLATEAIAGFIGGIQDGNPWMIALGVAFTVMSAQAVVGAGLAALAWTAARITMVAEAIATTVANTAQAALSSAAWVASAVASGIAWLLAHTGFVGQAIATAVANVANAATSSGAWVAAAVASSTAWLEQFAVIRGAAAVTAALIASPIVFGVIIIAAALAALALVEQAANRARAAIDDAQAAANQETNMSVGLIKDAGEKFKRGEISRAERDRLINIYAKAKGGPVSSGQPYLVGEEGPEIFTPKSSGRIIPNDKSMSMMNSGSGGMSGQTVNITIQAGAFMSDQQDARKYARLIMKAWDDAQSMGTA